MNRRVKRKAVKNQIQRWTDNRVPYEIDFGYSKFFCLIPYHIKTPVCVGLQTVTKLLKNYLVY